jgi:hypothetical protein
MHKPDYADYFKRKHLILGLERADVLTGLQTLLDGWYPGLVRAKRLHQGSLQLVTRSAGVAGELRMRQVEVLDAAEKLSGERPKRLAITIGELPSRED